jgi:hypothetical protein
MPCKIAKTCKSSSKKSPTRRLDDPGSWKDDESYWLNQNREYRAFAEALHKIIEEIGPEKLSEAIHRAETKFMMERGVKEFKKLSPVDKRYLGEIREHALVKTLGLPKNDEGLDTYLLISVEGLEKVVKADIKSSEKTTNKDRIEENERRIEENKKRIEENKRLKKLLKMLPPSKDFLISRECWGSLCILISMCTYSNKISIGLLDCSVEGFLNPLVRPNKAAGGPGRDDKRSLSTLGKNEILWILHMFDMPHNPLICDEDKAQKCRKALDEIFDEFYDDSIRRQNDEAQTKK